MRRVSNVKVNSPAYDERIQPGDKILMVNQTPVTTAADAKRIIDEAQRQKREAVLLQVQRGDGAKVFIGVRSPPAKIILELELTQGRSSRPPLSFGQIDSLPSPP